MTLASRGGMPCSVSGHRSCSLRHSSSSSVYKSLWLARVFVPHLARGSVPAYAWILAVGFAGYVVLDVIAIPFSRLLGARRA